MNTDDFALALSIAFLGSTLAMILILAVRRRVSRHFGASTTYALWFTLGLWFLLPLGALVTTHEAGDPDFVLWTASQEVVSDLETEANSIPAARWPSTPIASPSLSLIESSRLIWIAGAIFWLASLVLIQIRFHRALLAQAKPASPEIVSLTEVLSRSIGLKRPVEIRMIDRPGCPFVIGLLRQSIILPSSFLRDYTEDEQRLALIHELTHIKRHDQWAKCAALVFRALQWPNPVVHFAYKAFCIDQEVNCDSDVLSGQDHTTYDYAAVIAKAARSEKHASTLNAQLILSFGHSVKERLFMMRYQHPRRRRMATFVSVCLSIILAGVAMHLPHGHPDSKAYDTPFAELGVSALPTFLSSDETSDDREIFILELIQPREGHGTILIRDVGDIANLDEVGVGAEILAMIRQSNTSAAPDQNVDIFIGRRVVEHVETTNMDPPFICLAGYPAGDLKQRIAAIGQVVRELDPTHPALGAIARQLSRLN